MPKLKYVGPIDTGVEVVGIVVKHGHQFEVSDADAGRPPSARYLEWVVERDAAGTDHVLIKKLEAEFLSLDIGEGLLAQSDNFQPVPGKAKEADKP